MTPFRLPPVPLAPNRRDSLPYSIHERLRHRRPRWPRTPNTCAASTCRTAAAVGGTGAPGTCAGHRGARCSCALSRPARSGNGRIPPSNCTATCSISSGSPQGARSLREALAEARRFLAQPLSPAASRPGTYDRTEAARNLWNRCQPIDGSHAELYLKARGIRRCRFPALRFHHALPYCSDSGGWRRYPALVRGCRRRRRRKSRGFTVRGSILAVPAKANVAAARKSLGRIHGFAVRFGEPAAASTLLGGRGDRRRFCLSSPCCRTGVLRSAGPSPTFAASALSGRGARHVRAAADGLAPDRRPGPRRGRRTCRAPPAASVHPARHRLRGARATRRGFQ